MSKGRITIPTDETFVEGTKRIAKLWGADAVRDCDGVKLPDNPHEIAGKVYNVYFVDRGNHEWAKTIPTNGSTFWFRRRLSRLRKKRSVLV